MEENEKKPIFPGLTPMVFPGDFAPPPGRGNPGPRVKREDHDSHDRASGIVASNPMGTEGDFHEKTMIGFTEYTHEAIRNDNRPLRIEYARAAGNEFFCGISRDDHPGWPGWKLIDGIKEIHGESAITIVRILENHQGMARLLTEFWKSLPAI
jgi:hypothetical protein